LKWGSDCRWCVPDRTKRRGGSPIQALQQQKGLSHLYIVDLHGRKPENANTQERVGAGSENQGLQIDGCVVAHNRPGGDRGGASRDTALRPSTPITPTKQIKQ
jgi:hypothetical protein